MNTTDVCPECGGTWKEDLDVFGVPYGCNTCQDGTIKIFDLAPLQRNKIKVLKKVSRNSIYFED